MVIFMTEMDGNVLLIFLKKKYFLWFYDKKLVIDYPVCHNMETWMSLVIFVTF